MGDSGTAACIPPSLPSELLAHRGSSITFGIYHTWDKRIGYQRRVCRSWGDIQNADLQTNGRSDLLLHEKLISLTKVVPVASRALRTPCQGETFTLSGAPRLTGQREPFGP